MKSFEVEALLNVAAQVLQLAFPLLLIFVASIYLDNASFLDLAAVTYWLAIQTTVIGFGFDTVVTKDIAEAKRADLSKLFSLVVYFQIIIWLFLLFVLAGYASYVDVFPSSFAVAIVSAAGYAIGPPWLAMALGLNNRVLVFGLIVRVVGLSVIIICPRDIVFYYLVFVVVALATSMKIFASAVQEELLITDRNQLRQIVLIFAAKLRPLSYSFFAKLSVAAYTTAIPLGVSQYTELAAAKAFVVADKLKNIINYGMGAVLPVFNRFYLDPVIKSPKLMFYYIFGLTILIALNFLIWFAAPTILMALNVNGENAQQILTLMCLSVIPIYLTNYFGLLNIFMKGYMKTYLLPLAFAGIFALVNIDIVLNYFGTFGVALMSLSIEVIILIVFIGFHVYYRRLRFRD